MIERLNPDTLHHNPAFTQAAVIPATAKLVFVGGQNGVNKEGKVVSTNLTEQTVQALKNVQAALAAAQAGFKDVFKITVYIVQGQSINDGFAAAQQFPEMFQNPPTISVLVVAALGNPEFLVEIEAVAALPG